VSARWQFLMPGGSGRWSFLRFEGLFFNDLAKKHI
jgi:hypothetical protein